MQGIEAVVGAISRNLADLQDHEGNHISIYDQPSLRHPVFSHIYRKLYAVVLPSFYPFLMF